LNTYTKLDMSSSNTRKVFDETQRSLQNQARVNYENYIIQRELVQVGLKSHMCAFGPTKDASIIPVLRVGEVLTTPEEVQSYIDEVEALLPPPPLVLYTQTFSTVGTTDWIAPARTTSITYLIVGGGGGGGGSYDNAGSGGGGGGLALTGTYTVLPGATYTVVVGDGGAGGIGQRTQSPPETSGADGESSSFDTIIAAGGGGGLRSRSAPGGNGVGGAAASDLTAPQGGNGGRNGGGGGGGGNVANGQTRSGTTGGAGGSGLSSSITGTLIQYGAGGRGGSTSTSQDGSAGTNGRGNGGGGAGSRPNADNDGGKGGSGTVIIQFFA
jgi:hypothetical protein